MPVKRRAEKRRTDPIAEAGAWAEIFDAGYDFFGTLAESGVDLDEYGRAETEAVRDAWARLGRLFLDSRLPDPHRVPWAQQQFGDPPCR